MDWIQTIFCYLRDESDTFVPSPSFSKVHKFSLFHMDLSTDIVIQVFSVSVGNISWLSRPSSANWRLYRFPSHQTYFLLIVLLLFRWSYLSPSHTVYETLCCYFTVPQSGLDSGFSVRLSSIYVVHTLTSRILRSKTSAFQTSKRSPFAPASFSVCSRA
jgi:hypothetical protein